MRGINRGLKKIVNKNKIPNLAKYDDIADFVLQKAKQNTASAYSSESEVDDLPDSKITLPSDY